MSLPQPEASAEKSASPANELFRKEARTHLGLVTEGEIRLAQPLKWSSLAIFGAITLLLCLALGLAVAAATSETIIGRLEPRGGVLVLAVPEGGQVTELLAQPGDDVWRAQPLVRLRRTTAASGVGQLDREMRLLSGRIASIRQQRRAARSTFRAGAEGREAQISLLESMNETLRTRVSMHRRLLEQEQRTLADLQRLASEGLIARTTLSARQGEVTAREETIAELLARAEQNAAETLLHRTQLRQEAGRLIQEIGNHASALAEASNEQARLIDQQDLVVRAPVDGRLSGLPAKVGDLISAGGAVGYVHSSSELVGEFIIPPHLASRIRPGQRLNLRVVDLSASRFGAIEALITSLEGPMLPPEGDQRVLSYRMHVLFIAILRCDLTSGLEWESPRLCGRKRKVYFGSR